MNTSPIMELLGNSTIIASLLAWLCAQAAKMICALVQTRRINFTYFASTGGMPSAHCAIAGAIIASIGLRVGMSSPVFAVALAFAGIVMFDAQSVRRAAGMQARLLNQIVEDLLKAHKLREQKLAELLGHTRLEVLMGLLIGVFMAVLIHAVWLENGWMR